MKFLKRKNMAGFTLIELMAYLAIFIVIFALLITFILWTYNGSTRTMVMQEVSENLRQAMNIMTREIRAAQAIYGPTTSANQLSLVTTRYQPIGEITSYLDFFICSDRICLKKEGLDPVPITSDKIEVKSLVFSQLSAGSSLPSVQIYLELVYRNPSGKSEYDAGVQATSTASLRLY